MDERLAAVNEGERRRWNDEAWIEAWPKRELLTGAVTSFVVAAAGLEAGERVLDIGSGGGRLAIEAARAVGPAGGVVGADISLPLTELARRRAREAAVANVEFRLLDVQIEAVEGGPFDVALSQFGVMFFDEPVVAFANIHAQLRPGGRLCFACWQANELNPWFYASALAGLIPAPPEPAAGKSATGPFTLADVAHVTELLGAAGFADIRDSRHRLEVEVPDDAVVDDAQLVFMGVGEADLPAARAAVAEHMRRFALGDGRSRLPLAFQVFTAEAS
jgi:SAM-dependent methyltransferase